MGRTFCIWCFSRNGVSKVGVLRHGKCISRRLYLAERALFWFILHSRVKEFYGRDGTLGLLLSWGRSYSRAAFGMAWQRIEIQPDILLSSNCFSSVFMRTSQVFLIVTSDR